MELTIFGATGTVGRHLVEQALAEGHSVRAFARRPERLGIAHERLALVAGDVLDYAAVTEAVDGADAVLVTIGSKKLTGHLRSEGTRNIVAAMQALGVRRLVCQTSLGTGESRGNLNFFWKYIMFGGLLRLIHHDTELQERIVRDSGLDWVIVRPAAFVDDPLGRVRHGFGPMVRDLTLTIARSDVARFMLGQIADFRYLRQAPGLSY